MKVAVLNTEDIQFDSDRMMSKLDNIGITDYYFSDYRFCPYIICYMNPTDGNIMVDNINDGYMKALKERSDILYSEDIDDFCSYCLDIKNGYNSNELF